MTAEHPPCPFCGLKHPPCDLHHCYCGETQSDMNGEGFNEKCAKFWVDGDKQGAS